MKKPHTSIALPTEKESRARENGGLFLGACYFSSKGVDWVLNCGACNNLSGLGHLLSKLRYILSKTYALRQVLTC